MTRPAPLRRRRFVTIAAAAAGLALPRPGQAEAGPELRRWTGTAMGADAMLLIAHPDPRAADRLIAQSLAEVARLERVFSLYRADSALVRLNRLGRLDDPAPDLLRLLSESLRFAALTGGAFDVTVQPLWDLYAAHFGAPGADPAGPPADALAAALRRIGWRDVRLDTASIRLARAGMGVTLNGIAQGYVTDRVVECLRDAGIAHALVDMGETRALGSYPDGTPWSVGLADPVQPEAIGARVPLVDRAVATSGGYGLWFDPAHRFNHIFDPADGGTSWRYRSVSVVAADATTADALSTAFSLLDLDRTRQIVAQCGVQAHFVLSDGSRLTQA